MEYRGYTITKITRVDWMVKDENGNVVFTDADRPTTRTLKEAKALIEALSR